VVAVARMYGSFSWAVAEIESPAAKATTIGPSAHRASLCMPPPDIWPSPILGEAPRAHNSRASGRRNGRFLPERTIQAGIGAVPVRQPRKVAVSWEKDAGRGAGSRPARVMRARRRPLLHTQETMTEDAKPPRRRRRPTDPGIRPHPESRRIPDVPLATSIGFASRLLRQRVVSNRELAPTSVGENAGARSAQPIVGISAHIYRWLRGSGPRPEAAGPAAEYAQSWRGAVPVPAIPRRAWALG
jgi:hypothetical protein